jgi:NitT/TauT family transport system permease protein
MTEQLSVLRPEAPGPASGVDSAWKRGARHTLKRSQGTALQVGFIIFLLIVWQLLGTLGLVDKLVISSPPDVWRALIEYFHHSSGWSDLGTTLYEFVVGFAISLAIGVPLGLLLGYYRWLDKMTAPVLIVLLASPRVAFIPVFLIWLGIGPSSKIAIVVFSAVVPVALATKAGVAQADRDLIRVCRAYGGTDWDTFRTVILPSSVPSIAAGVRLGTGFGLLAVIIGEYQASNAGIGYQLQLAGSNFQTGLVFALVLVAAAIGVVLSSLASVVERYVSRWRPKAK